jgi:hypothetical protein
MRRRSGTLILVGSLVAGLLVGASASAATAGYSSSLYSYFTAGVFQYRAFAGIETSSYQVRGSAGIKREGASTPINYVGANARYFRSSDNALIAESGFIYNSAVVPDYLNMVVYKGWSGVSTHTNYYGWGVVKGSDGGSYSTNYTFKSDPQTS